MWLRRWVFQFFPIRHYFKGTFELLVVLFSSIALQQLYSRSIISYEHKFYSHSKFPKHFLSSNIVKPMWHHMLQLAWQHMVNSYFTYSKDQGLLFGLSCFLNFLVTTHNVFSMHHDMLPTIFISCLNILFPIYFWSYNTFFVQQGLLSCPNISILHFKWYSTILYPSNFCLVWDTSVAILKTSTKCDMYCINTKFCSMWYVPSLSLPHPQFFSNVMY